MKGVLANNPSIQQSANPVLAAQLPGFLRAQPDGVLLSVKLQPRASKNEIGTPLGDELKIKVTAPPVDTAANQALVELLAEKLNCPRGRVELIRGQTSRHKTIKLYGFKPEEVLLAISGKS
jgi:uncharacterized protein (TIGR00251 family)